MADPLSQLALVAHASEELPVTYPSDSQAAGSASASASSPAVSARANHSATDRIESLKARRRVPSSLRKRAQASCDACKIRRCKCQRPSENTADSCKLCMDMKIQCVTTLPRKQRFYGSVESLDKKYRALEALVVGFFPDITTNTTAEELVTFGQRLGIKMPDFEVEARNSQGQPETGNLTPTRPSTSLPLPNVRPSAEHDSSRPSLAHSLPALHLSNDDQSSQYNSVDSSVSIHQNTLPPFGNNSSTGIRQNLHRESSLHDLPAPSLNNPGGQAFKDVKDETFSSEHNGGLLKDTSGRPHYIGPSGSLAFFAKLRDLVAQQQRATPSTAPGSSPQPGDGQSTMADDFIRDKLAGALDGAEQNIETPYAMNSPNELDRSPRVDTPSAVSEDSRLTTSPGSFRSLPLTKNSSLQLPPKGQADACVDAFFRIVHPSFILFHRATFQRTYESLWRKHSGLNKNVSISTGWRCCLYMIFVFGSRSLPQDSSSLDFQRHYYYLANQVSELMTTSSLPNVCALMLLSLYAHNTNSRTSSWTLLGAATRLAIALGMHRESVSGFFEPLHRELRKRVWWTLYSFEQFLCCSLGRPSAIDNEEVDIGVPSEDLLDGNITPPRYIEHASKLYEFLSIIRKEMYNPSGSHSRVSFKATQILGSLMNWEQSLPRHLHPQPLENCIEGTALQWRSVLMLHVRYQHTICFLSRPFLLHMAQATTDGKPLGNDALNIIELSNICVNGAMRCGELLVALRRADCFNGVSWLDVFYAYSSCMILTLRILTHTYESRQQVTQQSADSADIQKTREMVRQLLEVMQTVQMCGTMARFAKVSEEFAKVVGISTKTKIANNTSDTTPAKVVDDAQSHSIEHQPRMNIGASFGPPEVFQAVNMNPHTALPMSFVDPNFMGVYSADANPGIVQQNTRGMQWDMVMQPAEWNETGDLALQLDWGWQFPTETAT